MEARGEGEARIGFGREPAGPENGMAGRRNAKFSPLLLHPSRHRRALGKARDEP